MAVLVAALAVLLLVPASHATLPIDLVAADTPNDGGGSISLSWKCLTETSFVDSLISLELYRLDEEAFEPILLANLGFADSSYRDDSDLTNGQSYRYHVKARFPTLVMTSAAAQAVSGHGRAGHRADAGPAGRDALARGRRQSLRPV